MNNPSWLKLRNNFVIRSIGPNYFLVPLKENPFDIRFINSTGKLFWELLHKRVNLKESIELVANKYQVDKVIIKKDLINFIKQLSAGENSVFNQNRASIDIISKGTKVRIPLKVSFELTGKCNLNCFHCYAYGERKNKDLSTDQVKDLLNQLVKIGCIFINLTGGECTSRSDFVEIYKHIRKVGLIPTIISNATLIKEEVLQIFKKYPPYHIKISLYGSTSQTHDSVTRVIGSFQKTVAAATALKKAGINVWFGSVIFKETAKDFKNLKLLAKNLGIPIEFYSQLIPTLEKNASPLKHQVDFKVQQEIKRLNKDTVIPFLNRENIDQEFIGEKFFPCNAGLTSLHLDCSGNIYLCRTDRVKPISALNKGLATAWDELGKIRDSKLKIPTGCKNCPIKYNLFKDINKKIEI